MLLSGAVESTCNPSVCRWAFAEKQEVNPSLQEDQKEPELQKKTWSCVGAALRGHWSEVDPFRLSIHHPVQDKLQHLSEMVLKDFWQWRRWQMGGRDAARESRDGRCQPNCVQQEVQLFNQTQHWNCTNARCNSHTWCISQLVLYRFPTTPSVKDATITAPHRWGILAVWAISVKLHANSLSICLRAAVQQSQILCSGMKATYVCVISCA